MSEIEIQNSTFLIDGLSFTPEGRIIAALVIRLGGKVKLTLEELSNVQGLVCVDGQDFRKEVVADIELEASSIPPKLSLPYIVYKMNWEDSE